MKWRTITLALACMVLSAGLAFAQAQQQAGGAGGSAESVQMQKNFQGRIGKAGDQYVIKVGNNVYALQGNQSDIENLWGEQVNVQGWLDGQTLNVSTISPQQIGGQQQQQAGSQQGGQQQQQAGAQQGQQGGQQQQASGGQQGGQQDELVQPAGQQEFDENQEFQLEGETMQMKDIEWGQE